jgi:hypothetical protein
MIAIKRVCKFFDSCRFADEKSRTCTADQGGNYCGVFRALSKVYEEKERKNEE